VAQNGAEMRLILFDVDGTLTGTVAVDDRCFVQAFADVFGVSGFSTDWSGYEHATDAAITREVLWRAWGRDATRAEIDMHRERFLLLLEEARFHDPGSYGATSGAAELLRALAADRDCAVAIATGGWRATAAFKLAAAGLSELTGGLPWGTAEDGLSRDEILAAALARSKVRYEQTGFSRIVLVGDAVWDVRTARRLGLAFLGVGAGETADRLSAAGAYQVVADFADLDGARRALETAAVPRLPAPAPAPRRSPGGPRP
jgi:phosphoglycolate phosphatase-like HAD superfamily hydrolase